MMSKILIVFVGLMGLLISQAAHTSSAPAFNDTTIRVLLVGDLSVVSPTDIEAHIDFLESTWANSDLSTIISITIANAGIPIEYDGGVTGMLSGSLISQVAAIETWVSEPSVELEPGSDLISIRDAHAADIVIGFSLGGAAGDCGGTPLGNWLNFAHPPLVPPNLELNVSTFGLDLRDQDKRYVSIISLTALANCDLSTWVTAHEFGHLLGGYHWDDPGLTDIHGLYSDSKADRWARPKQFRFWPPPDYIVWQSANGTLDGGACDVPGFDVVECDVLAQYGNIFFGLGEPEPTHNNLTALNDTAESVANYRRGDPLVAVDTCSDGIDNDGNGDADGMDPECTGTSVTEVPPTPPPLPGCSGTNSAPVGVFGVRIPGCVTDQFGIWTPYRVRWSHSCPGQVDFYQVYFSQPDGSGFVFGWNTFSPSTDMRVIVAPSRLKIKSCKSGLCSQLSSSSFLAVDVC